MILADQRSEFVEKILLKTVRLKRRAGLARHYEQRPREIEFVLDGLDLSRNGRVENVKIRLAKRHRQHLRAQRRTAHSHQQNIGKSGVVDVLCQLGVFLCVGKLFANDGQPAEPFSLVFVGPDGRVFCPHAGDLVVTLPGGERGVYIGLDRWGQRVFHCVQH